jgi:hypothetical protein
MKNFYVTSHQSKTIGLLETAYSANTEQDLKDDGLNLNQNETRCGIENRLTCCRVGVFGKYLAAEIILAILGK